MFLDDLFYEYQKDENGPKIIDIKDFVFEKLVEKRNTCKCCLLFLKDCPRNSNYYEQMTNIDDMYFKKTELYKGKDELVIFIKKGENCTCNNLAEYKKVLQTRKKQEKEIEELKKTIEEEKKKREDDHKKVEEEKKKAEEEKKKAEEEKKKEEEKRERENNRFKEINNTLRIQLQLLNQKIEEDRQKEKDKKLEKEIIKGKIINDFLINLPKVVNDYFHDNFGKMVSNCLKEINKLFDEKISFDQISKDSIKEIAEEENFAINIKDILENEINLISNEDEISKINHFNILVMGRSGVGKSTLLNKVLKKEVSKTKDFDYCTPDIESYESEKVNGLRIWDTRGIEYKYNISNAFQDISAKIHELINDKNPDKYIHCIWFCIKGEKGERLNQEIQDLIHNFYNLYNIQKLPIIIVFTNSSSTEESEEFIDFARREFQKFDDLNYINKVKFIRVLAKDKKTDRGTIPANGIYNLMEETFDSVKTGMKSSLIESLTQKGKEFINRKLQKIIDNFDYKQNLDVAPLSNYDNYKPDNLFNNDNNSSDDIIISVPENRSSDNEFNEYFEDKNNSNYNIGQKYNQKNNNNIYQENRNINTNQVNNNSPQTPEEFDINNLPLNLGKIKYDFESFQINLKNNCEEITIKLLNSNKLTNKKLFSKIYNAIEKIVNLISENFEEIYSVEKKKNI